MPDSEQVRRARELRKHATKEENILWYRFLRGYPARFRRQQPIGPYIVDFFCPSRRLVIELDGGGHYQPEKMEYDRRRDVYLVEQGLRVLRFTNLEVRCQFPAVCAAIQRAAIPPQAAERPAPPQGGAKCSAARSRLEKREVSACNQ